MAVVTGYTNQNSISGTGSDGMSFGVLPVTIDSSRVAPYAQYSMMKPRDLDTLTSTWQDDSVGAQLPYEFSTETSAPIFSVAIVLLGDAITVTADDLSKMLSPCFFSYPNPSVDLVQLEWDYQNPEYSLFDSDTEAITMSSNQQYVLTTSPIDTSRPSGQNWFNDIPPGICYFSINPTPAFSDFDGTRFGILGVSCRLQLNARTV